MISLAIRLIKKRTEVCAGNNVFGWLNNISHRIIDFIFPASCPLCGASVSTHGELCADCWTAFNWIDGTKCHVCGRPLPDGLELGDTPMCSECVAGNNALTITRSACVYDDASRAAVLPFKHVGKIQYGKFMAHAMIWALRDVDFVPDVVMPVPLATRRLRHRAYNQAALLAKPIARAYGASIDYDSVHRKWREDMGHKNARARAENIRGVFSVAHPKNIRGKTILLVDDVMTTGATFRELRRVLMRAGAVDVYGVTFCRVSRT